MSSQVVGAALGGAPEDRLSSEDEGPQEQQQKDTEKEVVPVEMPLVVTVTATEEPEPVVTVPAKDPRPTNSARRTGGGQVPSKSQSGNNECQFFFEDEVFRIDRRGRVHFGVITETAESYSSDEDEEVDEVLLSKGEVRVAFYPDGKEMVHTEQSVSKPFLLLPLPVRSPTPSKLRLCNAPRITVNRPIWTTVFRLFVPFVSVGSACFFLQFRQ